MRREALADAALTDSSTPPFGFSFHQFSIPIDLLR
jgi:hypothetical protein